MDRKAFTLLFLFLATIGPAIQAQQKTKNKSADEKGTATAKHVLLPQTYLGNSEYRGGPIQKKAFDNLLKQGITSRDSSGNKYKVIGFDITYAEKGYYEDSIGNLLTLMDYSSSYCEGDTVAATVSASIYDRTKAGDTVFIDHVKVIRPTESAANAFMAKGMKFYIIK